MAEQNPSRPSPLNPIVAFMIGLSIILLASIMNAAGLNLTKLDHVRTSAIPKSARRPDWARPLWLLGMILYILSQLLGSTLALEYMRAEYVAPLGSTSLIFNFLFARFLVGTPVTSTDIYGTIIVVLGVIGIVAFGSINSGLTTETDVTHLTRLWRRGGWLGFFFCMSGALIALLVVTGRLDDVLTARGDLSGELTPSPRPSPVPTPPPASPAPERLPETEESSSASRGVFRYIVGFFKAIRDGARATIRGWKSLNIWITGLLETWTAAHDDKQIAWTLGIGWACCGGGLAGGTLVFAKATVKLLSGALKKENTGNQFGHAAPIFTIILLAVTAVFQIICLNRGLRVYDSTLVVPVFYGVYTATGWLDSLIFNDEVDAYQSWTLFLIFVSILVLISGVVLLTHKKPEPKGNTPLPSAKMLSARRRRDKHDRSANDEESRVEDAGERTALYSVGDESDSEDLDLDAGDEDADHHQNPLKLQHLPQGVNKGDSTVAGSSTDKTRNDRWASNSETERSGLMDDDDGPLGEHQPSHLSSKSSADQSLQKSSSSLNLAHDPFKDNDSGEFGEWQGVSSNTDKR